MIDFAEFKARYQKVPVEEYPNCVLEAVPEPTVSVKISTYQHADFIRECLDGILMQETDFPFEILIGEDESSDGTREICKAYADRHPDKIRLFLHRRENNIAIHGRPTGKFQSTYTRFMCRGTHIALCEGDDYWTDPLKLQKQVEFMEARPTCVLTYHPWVVKAEEDDRSTDAILDQFSEDRNWAERPLTCTLMHRRVLRSIPAVGLNILNGDTFFQHLLRLRGHFACVEHIEPSVYRYHQESLWSSGSRIDQALSGIHSLTQMWPVFEGTSVDYLVSGGVTHWLEELYASMCRTGDYAGHLRAFACAVSHIHEARLLFKSVVGPFVIYPLRSRMGKLKSRLIS